MWPGPVGRGGVTLAGDALHPMTPNLGQGGCAALEDAVELGGVLARLTADGRTLSRVGDAELAAALRGYEAARGRRCLPLSVRSWAFGFLLQLPAPPVTFARNLFVSTAFSPAHFLNHTDWEPEGEEGGRRRPI